MIRYSVVIPTIGRPSLRALLESLGTCSGALPERIVVVDDRRSGEPLDLGGYSKEIAGRLLLLRSEGCGPAAARNRGWRATQTPWVVFVDDDVLLTSTWCADLQRDLQGASESDGGIQARVEVPMPARRPPTDWERNVRGLMDSLWITADMAYRRTVLDATGGFDERFKRAYREDADLAIRARAAGFALRFGNRRAIHPVRTSDRWISVRLQRGNADDILMRALHGPGWRRQAGSPRGRFAWHAATVVSAGVALAGAIERRNGLAVAGTIAWLALTADFAWRRIGPGPRTPAEVATMAATSTVIPFAAVYHKLRGVVMLRALLRGEAA